MRLLMDTASFRCAGYRRRGFLAKALKTLARVPARGVRQLTDKSALDGILRGICLGTDSLEAHWIVLVQIR